MNLSNNYELNLPSRDGDDIVDVNLISENFETIDSVMANNNKLIRANRELIMTNHRRINELDEKLNELEISGGSGKSAYEIWLEQGNTGSEADFIASLKGDSYTLTEDDKEEINSEIKDEVGNQLDGAKADIVTELIAQIGGIPVFGTVSDDNTITLTSMLADGVYTMVYENEEGIIEEITSFTVGNGDKPNINEYEVDVSTVGYTDNARWSTTDGTIRTGVTGYTAINKIPFERASGQTVTIKLSGITWTDSALTTQFASILLYVDDSYTTGNNLYLKELPKDFTDVGVRAVLNEDNSITITIYDGSNGTIFNGFKLCGVGSGANAKITITIE